MPGDEVEAVEIETVTAVKKKAKLQMEPVHNLNRKILKLRRVAQPHHHKAIQMLKAPEEIGSGRGRNRNNRNKRREGKDVKAAPVSEEIQTEYDLQKDLYDIDFSSGYSCRRL
jgi:hypothetical protein